MRPFLNRPTCNSLPTAATDSSNYRHIMRRQGEVLRCKPLTMTHEDRPRVHGINERTAVGDFRLALCVTRRALVLFGGTAVHAPGVAGSMYMDHGEGLSAA